MENPALNSSTEDDVVDSERFIDDDDDDDSSSVDSNYEIDLPTILQSTPSNDEVIEVSNSFHHQQQQQYYPQHRSSNKKNNRKKKNKSTTKKCAATLENVDYDADTIRREFKTYQHVLPDPDTLLQQHHSFHMIRTLIEKDHQLPVPRFLRYKFETGHVKPHHALCCLLLTEYQEGLVAVSEAEGEAEAVAQQQVHNNDNDDDDATDPEKGEVERLTRRQYSTSTTCISRSMSYWFVRMISLGYVYPQLDNPAEFIRDQFNRVAEVVPVLVVKAHELRNKIRNSGLPVPPYFLDPENSNQFPPHIALLVILQDDQQESEKFHSVCYRILFSLFAFVALLLRVVLEVIGGAGAIWGGGEVLKLRHGENAEVWRWFSITVGLLCLFRFITLNMPRQEDDGDILGPAGPWSLRFPVRIRAVAEHPFHYFFRAVPPFQYHNHNNNNNTTYTNPKKKD